MNSGKKSVYAGVALKFEFKKQVTEFMEGLCKYTFRTIRHELAQAVALLSDEEVSGAYCLHRFYLFNCMTLEVTLAFRPEKTEAEAQEAVEKYFPGVEWHSFGPARFIMDEHPVCPDGQFVPGWEPDADDFRRVLMTEVKVAAAGILSSAEQPSED